LRGSGDKTGQSSGIVLFGANITGKTEQYVLRYAPMNNQQRIFAEYDIGGQFHLQRQLSRAGLPVPNGRWLDQTGEFLGLPGFVMDAIDGEVAHSSAFTGGLIAEATEEARGELFSQIFCSLDKVHNVEWRRHGLDAYVRAGSGRTPIERYVNWFWKTAEWIRSPQMDRLAKVRDWLLLNQPDYHHDEYRLVHGDPGLGNYMFKDSKVVAIIDWELAGIIHPTFDLAMQCSGFNYMKQAASAEVAAKIPDDSSWIAAYELATNRRIVDFDYFRKLVTLMSLIVFLSIDRSLSPEMKAAHEKMLEPTWAIAEAV
jgi:aminoglycoside phosphotransferase (APT) family kinase protein